MRSKDEILKQLVQIPGTYGIVAKAHVERQQILFELLIDIRDVFVTDVKDAMNALIEIRKNQ